APGGALGFGGIDLDGRRQCLAQQIVGNRVGLAALERIRGKRDKARVRISAHGRRATRRLFFLRTRRASHRAQAGTGTRRAGACLRAGSLRGGTVRLNSFAALRPRMLRFACAERNGKVVIEAGRSKSQCGQSEANSSWVSALIASKVASVSFMFERSSGWLV